MEEIEKFEQINFVRKFENLFYELHFHSDSKKDIIRKMAMSIPWNISLTSIIDNFSDGFLRFSSRKFLPLINLEVVKFNLEELSSKGHKNSYNDLEKAVYLLSLVGDPNADYISFKEKLDSLAYRVNELFELNRSILTDEVKVHLLTRVLHQEEGYNGNHFFYDNPDNSFITKVIKSKHGIPITLSVLYMLVGHRVNLPLFGINIPLHFMISYESDNYTTYIDPFNGGILLDKETCKNFLESNGYIGNKDYFSKASTLSIMRRMYNNLIFIYRKLGEFEMEEKIAQQIEILEGY